MMGKVPVLSAEVLLGGMAEDFGQQGVRVPMGGGLGAGGVCEFCLWACPGVY